MLPAKRVALLVLTASLGCLPAHPSDTPRVNAVIAGGVGDEPDVEPGRPVGFASGGLVMVINPVVNRPSTGALAVPAGRAQIGITVGPRGTRTDASGLAMLDDLPVGTAVVQFPTGSLNVSIVQPGLVDVVALYNPDLGPQLVSELHYPRSGPDVLRLEEGVHVGSLDINEHGTVLYGEVSTDDRLVSILDGDLIIRANGVRVRNLVVTGRVTVLGNNASIAFSELDTVVIRGSNVLLLRDVLHTRPLITGFNVLLLDVASP
ncbi:MAG TPA: hypothetical protein PKG54_16705 [Phycisphaerae bacterium]|mgnify:FL=1|jgi:hypothetical protein|nr:hypothetical protein [Phycisphaerae bacterium]HOB76156.1 hypothetical protein [Phycisphaerae bacterium]HOL28260.1 hypothetical protein [Phycisphaerae bacterium]HPU34620.1 hypothetical protein [Phycisphaerae bacterium]HQA46769.1 hypothetical protein [Phycisphaerae bacterium]